MMEGNEDTCPLIQMLLTHLFTHSFNGVRPLCKLLMGVRVYSHVVCVLSFFYRLHLSVMSVAEMGEKGRDQEGSHKF